MSRIDEKPGYELTEDNVAAQVAEIHTTLTRLLTGITASQLNWQPEGGRHWSIGQCLDHLTKAADIYSAPIADAIAAAPAMAAHPAWPNLLGRAFLWFIEPPVRIKTPAPGTAHPASTFDPALVRSEFERTLTTLQGLAQRAVTVDSGRARFANPFAGGRRVFNVATGIMVLLAHARRHLLQAERVKARADFPSA
jgi:hypothetical protein